MTTFPELTIRGAGRVAGKTAVVTGGATGIGRAIVENLSGEGATVAVFDVADGPAAELVDTLRKGGAQASFHHVDVTDETSVRQGMAEVDECYGQLHILVNNAGITGPLEPTDRVDLATWRTMMDVNVTGPFLVTKHGIPLLRKADGGRSIIDICSIYGLIGNADAPSYHASKGAVRMMAKTDAMVYAPEGIRVNAVCPGTIMTPLNVARGAKSPGGLEAYLKEMRALHPLNVVGDPIDIAMGVLYLASDESRFVTGAELVIDGGFTAQ